MDVPSIDAPPQEWFRFLVDRMDQFDTKISNLTGSNEKVLKEIGDSNKIVKDLTATVSNLVIKNTQLREENVELNEKLLRLECYQRRENLVFEGIAESPNETDFAVFRKLIGIFSTVPELRGRPPIRISRCHRVGPFIGGRRRPVIAHFHWFGDHQAIYRSRGQFPKGIYVNEDLPPEIDDRNRELRPIAKIASKLNEYKGKVRLDRGKLIVKGKTYTVRPTNNLHELPDDLNPIKLTTREDADNIAFLRSLNPLSNLHPAPLKIDNDKYNSSEQYIQKCKAEMFNDDVAAAKIMNCTSTYRIKMLGQSVKGFVKPQWEREAKKIALKANRAKFAQNPGAAQFLLLTGNKKILEASWDKFWGIGVDLNDPNVLDSTQWCGDNTMGDVLVTVRDELKAAANS